MTSIIRQCDVIALLDTITWHFFWEMAKKWHGTYEGTFDVSISRIDIHLDECTKRWKFCQTSGKCIIFTKKNSGDFYRGFNSVNWRYHCDLKVIVLIIITDILNIYHKPIFTIITDISILDKSTVIFAMF